MINQDCLLKHQKIGKYRPMCYSCIYKDTKTCEELQQKAPLVYRSHKKGDNKCVNIII